MLVSGWLWALSVNTDLAITDFVAETAQPSGAGTDVLAVIALSTYSQGEGDTVGQGASYIRAYGTSSESYVDVPADPANNSYTAPDS